MSRTYRANRKQAKGSDRERQISARAVRRSQPDLGKLARAVIQLAMAEAEAEAQRTPTKQEAAE